MQPHSKTSDFTIAPVEGRVHIVVDDAQIIDSRRALRLERPGAPARIYVPMEDIRSDLLLATDERRQTELGEVHLYTVRTATATVENAAEYVSEPAPGVETLRDHVHFLDDKARCEISPV
ncbi:DUF427 domain-containing protein [Devosia geojensis]|uniref:DUF427 domain-containing protein n=1 Tax=Devosia geojensis TaxID=443610 RepID=UPI000696D936|nr:DUF427 domain-containing protein [Devosia geojensis]